MFSCLPASNGRLRMLLCALLLAVPSSLLSDDPAIKDPDLFGAGKTAVPERSPVIDGSFVHNIGRLQMNITNWGFVGSLPKSRYPMADVPSAQYPSGSGIEYLYAAGLWVGAEKNGIPFVTTGYPETEFYPEIRSEGCPLLYVRRGPEGHEASRPGRRRRRRPDRRGFPERLRR